MAILRDLVMNVVQPGRESAEQDRQRPAEFVKRPRLLRSVAKKVTSKISGDPSPQYRQGRQDGARLSTPEEVAQALELVSSACQDLQLASAGLHKRGGLIGAVQMGVALAREDDNGNVQPTQQPQDITGCQAGAPATAVAVEMPHVEEDKGDEAAVLQPQQQGADVAVQGSSGWFKTRQVLKTVGHDGRLDADKLILSAHNKYEQAADLVDGLPEIDLAESHAPALGKMAAPLGAAAQITLLALSTGAATVGVIFRVVKRRRTRKATASVDDMLYEYEVVREQLAVLHQAGQDGAL